MNEYLFVCRNYRGVEEINYLLSVEDFRKLFVSQIPRADFFSTHDPDKDWQNFMEGLDTGDAEWALDNNDTLAVRKVDEQSVEGCLDGCMNSDPIELISLNRDVDNIVDVIELYTAVAAWYLDVSNCSPSALEWAKSICPELVNDKVHYVTFKEAFEKIKGSLSPSEQADCIRHIEANLDS